MTVLFVASLGVTVAVRLAVSPFLSVTLVLLSVIPVTALVIVILPLDVTGDKRTGGVPTPQWSPAELDGEIVRLAVPESARILNLRVANVPLFIIHRF